MWINKFNKWAIIDAKYDLHFEKDGAPLSALEIRDEIWKDGGKNVVRSFGLDGASETSEYSGDFGPSATTYRWCSWENTTNRFTSFPNPPNSLTIMLDDEIFQNKIWYRDGKPHWAYNTPYLITTTRRDWIEWTPNVIDSQVTINDAAASIFLKSFTPNLETYQRSNNKTDWDRCDESLTIELSKPTNKLFFRTKNKFGVTGPVHTIQIEWVDGS